MSQRSVETREIIIDYVNGRRESDISVVRKKKKKERERIGFTLIA